jgi:hypothetical protein
MPSISQRVNASQLDAISRRELADLLQAARADIAALQARVTGLAAKLDADGGVTDTNYGALFPAPATTNLTA